MTTSNNFDGARIQSFFHCAQCVEEFVNNAPEAEGLSIAEYSKLSVGYTTEGVQIWCHRHGANVVHFAVPEGQKFQEVPG